MSLKKLKTIRPGDRRYIHLTFKNHDADKLYVTRRKLDGTESERSRPIRGTKTFVFEHHFGLGANKDPNPENLSEFVPDALSVHVQSKKRFLNDAFKRGIKVRVGERTRSKKEQQHFDAVESNLKQKFAAYANAPTYANYKKWVIAYCEKAKLRHLAIKRAVMDSLKDGSVELVYGRAHSTIASDLQKAGVRVNFSIEQGNFSWFAIIKRKAEKRLPIKEIDYKRAFVERIFAKARVDWSEQVFRKLRTLLGRASEEALDEIISNPKQVLSIIEHVER